MNKSAPLETMTDTINDSDHSTDTVPSVRSDHPDETSDNEREADIEMTDCHSDFLDHVSGANTVDNSSMSHIEILPSENTLVLSSGADIIGETCENKAPASENTEEDDNEEVVLRVDSNDNLVIQTGIIYVVMWN